MKYEAPMFNRKMISSILGSVLVTSLFFGSVPTIAQESSKSKKGFDEILDSETMKSIEHQKLLDEIRRKTDLASARAELGKLELEIKGLEKELNQLESQPEESLPDHNDTDNMMGMANNSMIPPIQIQDVPAPVFEPTPDAETESPVTLLDKAFVTRIFGISNDAEATIYIDGVSYNAVAGETINGVKVEKIDHNKVVLLHEGKRKDAYIMSAASASEMTARIQEKEARAQSSSNSGSHTFIPARMH